MRRLFRTIAIHLSTCTIAATLLCSAAVADQFVSLSHLAPALGYTYKWIGADSAVELTRPGVYVLVRTGNPVYDVNDSIESTAQAPQFRDNDIYIGPALVARLRTLALKNPLHDDQTATVVSMPRTLSGGAPHGSLSIAVAPTNVSAAVIVSGSGPANVPLTITLSADVSRDLPRILLSRTNVATDAAGQYSVRIPTAPLQMEKSVVFVSATSVPGVAEAHTSFVLGQPSPEIAHPVDELPRDFRPHR